MRHDVHENGLLPTCRRTTARTWSARYSNMMYHIIQCSRVQERLLQRLQDRYKVKKRTMSTSVNRQDKCCASHDSIRLKRIPKHDRIKRNEAIHQVVHTHCKPVSISKDFFVLSIKIKKDIYKTCKQAFTPAVVLCQCTSTKKPRRIHLTTPVEHHTHTQFRTIAVDDTRRLQRLD